MNIVWSTADMSHFARNYAAILGWPHFQDTPVGDCDTAYIIGAYDAPHYDWTLANTKRAKRRVIHWCGSDALLLVKPELLPEAIHLADSQLVRDVLLRHGIDAPVVQAPTVLHPPVTPLPEVPTVAVYFGSIPENYGASMVRYLQDVFPDVRWATYHNGQYGESQMLDLIASSTVVLRLTSHDGSAVGTREFLEAGRYALSTHAMPHAKHVSMSDPVGITRALRAALKNTEPNDAAAAYYREQNSAERFLDEWQEAVDA